MKQLFNFPIKMFHIELTNKCALLCPRCPRTSKQLQPQELPLFLIKKRFSPKICEKIDELDLAGNLGDPIYHTKLIEIVRYFVQSGIKRINIETNGTGKTKSWWRELARTLRPTDIVIFSIDGLQDTNKLYRVNSNWNQIMDGVSELSGKVRLWWKFIVFKHNQHQIEEAKEFAKNLGFNKFQISKSKLFGEYWFDDSGVDPLMPDIEYTSLKVQLTQNEKREGLKLSPRCLKNGHHFLSSDGIYSPCCWLATRRDKLSTLGLRGDDFNFYQMSLLDILKSEKLNRMPLYWSKAESLKDNCLLYCQVGENTCNQNIESQHDKSVFSLK